MPCQRGTRMPVMVVSLFGYLGGMDASPGLKWPNHDELASTAGNRATGRRPVRLKHRVSLGHQVALMRLVRCYGGLNALSESALIHAPIRMHLPTCFASPDQRKRVHRTHKQILSSLELAARAAVVKPVAALDPQVIVS